MTPAQLQTLSVCYSVTAHDQTVYIGVTRYEDLYRLIDARRMPLWSKVIGKEDTIAIALYGKFAERSDALAMQQTLIETFNPYINMRQPEHTGKRIICVDNDATFDNATTAANYAGVTRQAMSQHLTGKIHTINGKRFRRI